MQKRILLLISVFTFFSISAMAMDYKEAKVFLFKNGESIYGEEFIAQTEDVVDYLATLERPTGVFKSYKYVCQVKSRTIAPRAWVTGGTGGTNPIYTYITSVYSMKDCVRQ